MTLPIVFAIAGFVFLGIGLFGRIKLSGLELPPLSKSARVASAAFGAVLVPVSIILFAQASVAPPSRTLEYNRSPIKTTIYSGGTDFITAFPPNDPAAGAFSPERPFEAAPAPAAAGTAETNDQGE